MRAQATMSLLIGSLLIGIGGCGESDEERQRREQYIIQDELEAMEKAKQLEEDLQKAVDEKREKIEAQITEDSG